MIQTQHTRVKSSVMIQTQPTRVISRLWYRHNILELKVGDATDTAN